MHEYSKMITAQLLRSSCEAHGTCRCDGLCTDSWCEIAGDTRHGDGLSAKLGKPHEGSLVDAVCNPLSGVAFPHFRPSVGPFTPLRQQAQRLSVLGNWQYRTYRM